MNIIDRLFEMIMQCDNIVAFTGAGVSTDSGLKDFRSKDGLYNQKYDYPAEYMLSRDCFFEHTEMFYKYYKDNFNCLDILPNDTHLLLKKLEDMGKLKGIVTQNIDGLHTKAGNKRVYEVHGTIYTNHCTECNKEYDAEFVFNSKDIPRCECGGIIKPDVVLYGESLPEMDYVEGINAISNADMLIVEGSSLTVFPASNMINNFRGKYLVIINRDKTMYDSNADLVINDNLAKISKEIMDRL